LNAQAVNLVAADDDLGGETMLRFLSCAFLLGSGAISFFFGAARALTLHCLHPIMSATIYGSLKS
jgi:hypothetical protein